MEQTLGQHRPLLHAAAIGGLISNRSSKPNFQLQHRERPPLPSERSAPSEGKVETPARLRERRHRQHRELGSADGAPLRGPGHGESRSHRQRNREAPSSEFHSPVTERPRCRPGTPGTRSPEQPGTGDPPGHAGCGMPGPGTRQRSRAGPGGSLPPTGAARRRDSGYRDTRATPPGTGQPPLLPVKLLCTAGSPESARRDGTALPGGAAR